ncbi:E3 ubiquitin-protein ligase ZNF598 [Hondaea fermentalgiana]|uniref:E3 ubiquitin-protein ligase ZNF598 n=1 Tax=Hondaea fermentalgiana TaxID=2315210 RepID=A0A2R5G5M6_9STRA|nr:E3 ubiquitin-protein ligase ZNF598 [Hondaea fermentalgiana]|eukprot:GBG25845.1 E3 ubiquitin-protein ligase ZNF598 [Hondaea fermentalgiana]
MRLIHNDRRCVLCKHDLERVFVTTNLSKRYEEFQTWGDVAGPGLAFDSTTGMFFEELYGGIDHLREIESLRELRCSVEGCVNPGPFATVGKLKAHLQEMHSLHLCKLCWESRGVFPMEQKLYTKPELDRHCAEGEPDTAFRGHPMCRFCKSRWYNKDGLYAHLKEKHESCHICQREGKPYEYYRNYDNLYKHFVKDHFVCTEPECIEAKFNVYASELELRGHIVKNHPHVRVDRTVPVQFDFGLRGGEGTRRGDGTGASSSNIDSFSFQYMPGHVGHPSMTNQQPLAAPSFDDSAFPTLQADDSSTGASGAGRGARGGGSQYHAALGANMNSSSVLNDASQFPSLGPSAGSSSNSIHALRPGQDFSNAVQLPYSSLNPVVQTKQGQKKKKGKGKKMAEAPRPVVMSAEQEMRETMRLSTQQGSRPAAAPMPAPAHAPAQVPRPAPSPVNRDFAERRTPYGVHPQADGAQWARPKGQTQQRRVGGAGEDFPSLPMGSAALGGARGATSATAQWDALRGSNQIKSGVMIGTRSQAAKQTKKKKPKKKPADPLFDFTGR